MNEYAALTKRWQEKAYVLCNVPVLVPFYQQQIQMTSSDNEATPPQWGAGD
jgi:hypothetical protein